MKDIAVNLEWTTKRSLGHMVILQLFSLLHGNGRSEAITQEFKILLITARPIPLYILLRSRPGGILAVALVGISG